MRHFWLRLEPLVWLLFGNGLLVGTMLLTGWLLVFGAGFAVNALFDAYVIPPYAYGYARVHELAAHPVGRLVLLAMAALPLWKGAHHMRSLSIDFGGAERDPVVATLVYGIAAAGSLAAIVAVARL